MLVARLRLSLSRLHFNDINLITNYVHVTVAQAERLYDAKKVEFAFLDEWRVRWNRDAEAEELVVKSDLS
jgi:phenylalanyl-tRNA synthetase beta subunit